MVDWLANFGPDYDTGDGKMATDIAQKLLDLHELATVALVLHTDVTKRMKYSHNLNSNTPTLPLSLAYHYQKMFEQYAPNFVSSYEQSLTISFVTTRGEHENDTE